MQGKYELLPLASAPDADLNFQLFQACRRSKPGPVCLLKQYQCSSLGQLDAFLKSALVQAKFRSQELEVLEFIPVEETKGSYLACFLYKLKGNEPDKVLFRNDSHSSFPLFLTEYRFLEPLCAQNDLHTLYIASHLPTNQEVVIKTSFHYQLRKLRPLISKALIHAKLEHEGIGKIVDVAISELRGGYVLSLVFQRASSDLKREIARKRSQSARFTERELRRMLQELSLALEYIHGKVFPR